MLECCFHHETKVQSIFSEVKTQVIEWANRSIETANAFKKEKNEKLNEAKHDLEVDVAILQTGQQNISDQVKVEGYHLLKGNVMFEKKP